jgi:hypothetical protein
MALEEVTIYNTNGEEISLSNLVNQMINFYDLLLEVGETRLTDFKEGSEIRNLLEAFAVGIFALLDEQHEATRIAFISTSYGEFLDRIGQSPFINVVREEASEAVGEVTFTLSEAQTEELVIPADTIVASSETGLEFSTDADCVISIGEVSANVSVTCLSVGADGNVRSDSVDLIVDNELDTNLISVSNTEAFEFGADYEDDEVYRERLLESIRADGFGTVGWYENLCESIRGVHDVLLVDDENYTKKVLVNGTSKPTPDSILLEVLTILTVNTNHVINHSFTVDRPTYTDVSMTVTLDVATQISDDDLLRNLTCFVNGTNFDRMEYEGLNINGVLTRDMVVEAFNVFEHVVDVTSVVVDGSEMSSVAPAVNGVLKLGTVTFVQNEV